MTVNFKIFFPLLSKVVRLQLCTTTLNFYAILGIGPRVHCMLGKQVLSTELFISSPSFFLSLCGRYAYKPSTNKTTPLHLNLYSEKAKAVTFFLLVVAIYLDDDHHGPKAILTGTPRSCSCSSQCPENTTS